MYRSSKRKDKIRAAINNPINKELVQQLKEYLDYELPEDTQQDKKLAHITNSPNVKPTRNTKTTSKSSMQSPKMPHIADNSSERLPDGVFVDSKEDEDVDTTETSTPKSGTEISDDESDVAESTKVSANPISASTNIQEVLNVQLDEIKGLLNSPSDTAGVNRILTKNQELWIYYNDDVNLNNLLGPVVELINAANYRYLEFNRLARSDNAIVFQISECASEMNSINSDE